MREQLWRYFPALLELEDDMAAEWFLDLWVLAPTPDKALRVRPGSIAKLLKDRRIRRLMRPRWWALCGTQQLPSPRARLRRRLLTSALSFPA